MKSALILRQIARALHPDGGSLDSVSAFHPKLETEDGREVLYFSSTRNAHPAHDIFYSIDLGPAQFTAGGVNSSASDARPNVRHYGLEIVWDSTRTGSLGATTSGRRVARRSTIRGERPFNSAMELTAQRGKAGPRFSWDGTTLLFGSTRAGEGSADIYVSTRDKVTGSN